MAAVVVEEANKQRCNGPVQFNSRLSDGAISTGDRFGISFWGLQKDTETIKRTLDKWSAEGKRDHQFRLSKWNSVPAADSKILVS